MSVDFKLINISKWSRKEYFEYYLREVPCTYSMTVSLDLTTLLQELKKPDLKLYPTMIYLISMLVNSREEFRTAIDSKGNVGVFDLLHPSFTIFQKESETFTSIWTEYSASFSEFYKRYLDDVQTYGTVKSFMAKPHNPPNVFTLSSIPWVSFTGFNLNLPKETDYLLPIFTLGKYFKQSEKIELPFAVQVHHAICDGFHVARFISELQEAMNTFFSNVDSL